MKTGITLQCYCHHLRACNNKWVYKNHLCVVEWDEFVAECGGEGEEADWGPAEEVCEDEEGHALGDARVVRVPGVRTPDGAVNLRVAAHDDEERDSVHEHEEAHKPCNEQSSVICLLKLHMWN